MARLALAALLAALAAVLLLVPGSGAQTACEPTPAPTTTTQVDTGAELQAAVDTAAPGTIIEVRGGSYPLLKVGRDTPVTVRGYPGEVATIGGVSIAAGTRGFTLEDVDVLRPGENNIGLWGSTTRPAIEDVTIRRVRMNGPAQVGINARGYRRLLIEDVEISGIRRPSDGGHTDGIRTMGWGEDLVVRGVWLHDNEAMNFFIKDGRVNGVTVENSVIDGKSHVYDVTGLRMTGNLFGSLVFRGSGGARELSLVENAFTSLTADATVAPQFTEKRGNLFGKTSLPLGQGDVVRAFSWPPVSSWNAEETRRLIGG